ncbi:MAG: hypothetical protein EA376_14460 [Phycisphaeraceae bacterium]|nr:MAG: hypothetical protein EA376_14460 [Phycisphaeraceae bacterium]
MVMLLLSQDCALRGGDGKGDSVEVRVFARAGGLWRGDLRTGGVMLCGSVCSVRTASLGVAPGEIAGKRPIVETVATQRQGISELFDTLIVEGGRPTPAQDDPRRNSRTCGVGLFSTF